MPEQIPNGFFCRDLIVFNHLRRGGFVSKGFIFEAPDLTNSPVADLNDFHDQLCLLLASLHEHQRLQMQYFCDFSSKGELLRYQRETERLTNLRYARSALSPDAVWSLLTVMEKKQKKIHALMQGQTIPFHAMFAIRVWDKTRDGLNAKSGAIKNAINSMNAAQYFESNLPSTSKNIFFQTWPGWTWG